MTLSMEGNRRRYGFVAAVILSSVLAVLDLGRRIAAGVWGESADVTRIARALCLEPGNPALHHRVGVLYRYPGWEQGDAAAAIYHLRRATEISPHHAIYWSDLGSACVLAADFACAEAAFERATALAPRNARYAWERANYYFAVGQHDRGARELLRFLVLEPEEANTAFALVARTVADPRFLWDKGLGTLPATNAKLMYITFLDQAGHADVAAKLWSSVVADRPVISFAMAAPYLNHMIATGKYAQAGKVWRDLARLGTIADSGDNLIYNGDFSRTPLDGGFDWRRVSNPFVRVEFRDPGYRQGRAASVEFTVPTNQEYDPLLQIVPVRPQTSYRLSAYVRSSELTSDAGPRLRVRQLECSSCADIVSPPTIGTSGWHQLTFDVATGPTTEALQISVWRPRSRSFPMDICGNFWISDMYLQVASGSSLPTPIDLLTAVPKR